jgi:hypothetical protein
MKEQVITHLGEARVSDLIRFFRSKTLLEDQIEIAIVKAKRREITEAQKPIAAAISVLRRAGIPAPQNLLDAWEAAGASSGPLPETVPAANAGPSSPKMKPQKSKTA